MAELIEKIKALYGAGSEAYFSKSGVDMDGNYVEGSRSVIDQRYGVVKKFSLTNSKTMLMLPVSLDDDPMHEGMGTRLERVKWRFVERVVIGRKGAQWVVLMLMKAISTPGYCNVFGLRTSEYLSLACDSRMNVAAMMYEEMDICVSYTEKSNFSSASFNKKWIGSYKKLRNAKALRECEAVHDIWEGVDEETLMQAADDVEFALAAQHVENEELQALLEADDHGEEYMAEERTPTRGGVGTPKMKRKRRPSGPPRAPKKTRLHFGSGEETGVVSGRGRKTVENMKALMKKERQEKRLVVVNYKRGMDPTDMIFG